MASPFERAAYFGQQGRIIPAGWSAPEGDYVFCLGVDAPGRFEELDIGDYVEVSQTATFQAGTKLLRMRVKIRGPAVVPPGCAWLLVLIVGGGVRAQRRIDAGRTRELVDLSANVSKLVGAQDITLHLELIAA